MILMIGKENTRCNGNGQENCLCMRFYNYLRRLLDLRVPMCYNGRGGMKMKNQNIVKRMIADCALMLVLAFLFALDFELFVVKNQFAPAGINGIATMVEYVSGFSVGYFSLIVNIPLCLFAYVFIQREFAVKTLVFSLGYSLFLLVLRRIDLGAFQYDAHGVDTIFPALIAGALSGFVYGVAVRDNSSTGGVDIIAKYISEKDPMLNFFWVNFTVNAVIAAASYFVYATPDGAGGLSYNYKPVCLCMLYCFLSSYVGSAIIKGTKSAYKFFIITSHAAELDQEIFRKLHHSATILPATGAYSNAPRNVVVCVINKRQLVEFKSILKQYDDTFAFVETVNETIGNFRRGHHRFYPGVSEQEGKNEK